MEKDNCLASLRDITYGLFPFRQRSLPALRFSWLNTTQESAVNHVLAAQDIAIVHGPPGTGKTTTLVEAIYETLRRESQVMVCAQSNMAVDSKRMPLIPNYGAYVDAYGRSKQP